MVIPRGVLAIGILTAIGIAFLVFAGLEHQQHEEKAATACYPGMVEKTDWVKRAEGRTVPLVLCTNGEKKWMVEIK